MSGHDRGFVVQTTEHWRARVDPHTTLRLQNRDGAWTSAIHGHELHVDAAGLWIDQSMALEDRAEELEIAGAWRALIALVEASRPPDGALVVNGDRVRMSGARHCAHGSARCGPRSIKRPRSAPIRGSSSARAPSKADGPRSPAT